MTKWSYTNQAIDYLRALLNAAFNHWVPKTMNLVASYNRGFHS